MSVNPNIPRRAIIDHVPAHPQSPRAMGSRAVGKVITPGFKDKSQAELLDELGMGVRGVIGQRLTAERTAEDGNRLNLDVVNRAFLLQQRRLERPDITEELSTKELMLENLAQAILYAPTVSEGMAKGQTKIMSKYNDLLTQAAVAMPRKYMNLFVPVIRGESNRLNHNLGVPSEVGEKGVHERLMRGIRPEVCTARSLNNEGNLLAVAGTTAQDLRGIDLSVTRHTDDARAHFDIKNTGAYRNAVAKFFGDDSPEYRMAMESGYIRTGYDRQDSVAKYLLNPAQVAEIPDNGLEFSPKGEVNIQALVNEVLDYEVA